MSYSGGYGGGYAGEYGASSYTGEYDASAYAEVRTSTSQRTCDKCGKKGHISRYCPEDNKSKGEFLI